MRFGRSRMKLLFFTLIIPIILSGACKPGGGPSNTVILFAFSGMENVMMKEIIPSFEREWERKTGQRVQVITAFAGSGTITNQIIFGAPAQVAVVATEMDALNMRKKGLVTTDWRTFKHQGTFAYTTTALVTRKGEFPGISSFEDATKPGVDVVYPDPTTSGGAQWAILALYGSGLKTSEAASGKPDRTRAAELLKAVSINAGSLPESARRALTQFGLGYGDMLLTYENEALLDIASGKEYEIVVPVSTIYIEPKVVLIDRNVSKEEQKLVRGFVDFLWTDQSQQSFAKHHLRVWDPQIMQAYTDKFQEVQLPFTVEYLAGWEVATKKVIDQTWRQIHREIR